MKFISRGILALMLLAGALLLAFGPRPHADVPKDRVLIAYWEKWSADEAAAMKVIVDDFNNSVGADKKIFVEYLSMANVDRKTLAATAAGVPPDVAGLWASNVAPYAARNALLPLDGFAAQHGISPGTYKKVYWDMGFYNGRLYACPSTPAAIALHYNKRLFYESADKLRAAGLDPTRPPATIDEFDRCAVALDTYLPGTHRLDRAGYYTMEPGWYIIYTGFWFGGEIYDARTRRWTIDTPQNLRAFEWIASYSRRMGADALTDFKSSLGSFNSPQNPFFSRKVAMVQQGPWMANYIRNLAPDMSQVLVPFVLEPFLPHIVRPFNYEWAAAAFPSAIAGQTNVTAAESDVLMIPRGSKHPNEAFEFIAYIQRQDVMEKLCRLHCKNSPLAHASEEWVYTHPNPYIDVFDRLAASPNAHIGPVSPITQNANAEIDVAANQCYLLTKTPAEALKEAQQRVNRLCDQYERQAALRSSSTPAAAN